jgi:pimeloyl-ACP methyl ester carboxylesterase
LWKPVAVLAGLAAADALFETYRARQAERANPPRGRFIEVDGVRLHYIDRGGDDSRRPAVLLHGNGVMAEDFVIGGVVDHAACRRRVVSFDRPGFGHSERTRDRLWTPQAQAELLSWAFARLGLERPIVVGHSWGTLVALALALEQPASVAGLVLISGYYYPTERVDIPIFGLPGVPVLGDVLRTTVAPAFARMILPEMLRKSFSPLPPPERFNTEFPFALTTRPSQIRATAEDTAFMTPAAAELAPGYPGLQMPVVILAGTDDAIVDMQHHAARLRRDVPHSQLWVEPGVGHMLHYAAPALVAEAIDSVAARSRAAALACAGGLV